MMARNQVPPQRSPTGVSDKQSQLDRIEAKVDALLAALADDGDEEGSQHDLDGNLVESGERDMNESLD